MTDKYPAEMTSWAYLARVAEPPCADVIALVDQVGPVDAASAIRNRAVPDGHEPVLPATAARYESDRATEDLGAFADGKVVDIAQREHSAVDRRQLPQRVVGDHAVEFGIPRVVPAIGDVLDRFRRTLGAPPVIGELVPRDPDQPRSRRVGVPVPTDGVHRRQEGFRGHVLRSPAIRAATDDEPVDGRQCLVVHRQQSLWSRRRRLVAAHVYIVVCGHRNPTPFGKLFSAVGLLGSECVLDRIVDSFRS